VVSYVSDGGVVRVVGGGGGVGKRGRITLAMKRPNTAPRPNPIPPEITVLTGQDSMPAWICLPLGLVVGPSDGLERGY